MEMKLTVFRSMNVVGGSFHRLHNNDARFSGDINVDVDVKDSGLTLSGPNLGI